MTTFSDLKNSIRNGSAFCLFVRDGVFTAATGRIELHDYLAHINRMPPAGLTLSSISMIPFCQIKERDFEVADGGEKIISLVPQELTQGSEHDFFSAFPETEEIIVDGELSYNFSDEEYTQIVANIIEGEIRNGAGSNFLISRKAFGALKNISPAIAITLFKRLYKNEFGAYCTYCFFDGEHYFIGASPERHLSIESGMARMSPISGTLPKANASLPHDLYQFLADEKEINELFMVVDETLKMMMPLCPAGGDVLGPFLREMRAVIHTENELAGETDWDVVDAFRATMFAPTMVGSPIESACRVIYKHEKQQSRRYYSSALLILGQDDAGHDRLDSAITIRSVEILKNGRFTLQSGGSIVRDSVPEKETLEAKSKMLGMLKAITTDTQDKPILPPQLDAETTSRMLSRNTRLSDFWINNQKLADYPKILKGKSILILNNEDDFVHMGSHMLQHMGAHVRIEDIRNFGGMNSIRNTDIVILGPGPGDPRDNACPKIAKLQKIAASLLNSEQKFFGICLGHQIICHTLGIPLAKLPSPRQGVQEEINLFGETAHLGFYNTFCGHWTGSAMGDVDIAADNDGYIHALRGKNFGSLQAHPESVLSKDGYEVLHREIARLI